MVKRSSLAATLASKENACPSDEVHGDLVIEFIFERERIRSEAKDGSDYYKDPTTQRHNNGLTAPTSYSPGELVMLYDHREAKKKLRPSY